MGDIIGYKNSGKFRDVVLQDVLEMFSEKGNVKLLKLPSKKRINKIAVSSTIDLESEEIVKDIILGSLGKMEDFRAVNKKSIKPLYLFLDKEVLLYAKLKGLKYNKEKIEKNKICDFINKLEIKHPEVKRAVVNSFLKLS
jgi:tRNA(Ile)-lysidine synthase TilS/MesJ